MVFELHRVKLIDELAKIGITVNTGMAEIPTLIELYFDNTKNKPILKICLSKYRFQHYPHTEPTLLSNFPVFYQGKGDFKDIYISAIGIPNKKWTKILVI
ncbi:MAG: hypothetical protein IPI22_09830 [Bacteroidetes bacterium]|nr:hypothetical protein [Bacteroidota bacterium]